MMRTCAAAVLSVALSSVALAAPLDSASTTASLTRQAHAWDDAIVRKDRKAILANIGESFKQIDGGGRIADTRAFVAALLDPKLTIAPYHVEDFEVRHYGDTAILTGTTHLEGAYSGRAFSSHYRYTDVYVRRNGHWRIVNVQITPIR